MKGEERGRRGEKGGKEGENIAKPRHHFTFITGLFFIFVSPMVNKQQIILIETLIITIIQVNVRHYSHTKP